MGKASKRKAATPHSQPKRSSQSLPIGEVIFYLAIVAGVILFIVKAQALWFTQDDAYISYRYAQNALNGHGLVFNIGERVEGYTNFFWVLLLVLGGRLGFDFDLVAKVLGQGAGLGIILLAAVWVRAAWQRLGWGDGPVAGGATALLISLNGSFVYWAVSGLETVWFAFFVGLGIWFWVNRSWLSVPALAIAALTRPEGVFIWGLLILAELVLGDGLRSAGIMALAAILLLAPFGAFKLAYYHSLFPNPFYAKTGFSWEYVSSGLEYTWLYLQQYGWYGVVLIPTVLSVFALRGRWRVVPLLWIAYTLYITLVGGDVLKVHRFFVPVMVLLAVSFAVGIGWLAKRFLRGAPTGWLAFGMVAALAVTWEYLPKDSIYNIRYAELGLTQKMGIEAQRLTEYDTTNFSLAVSTIGRVSYELMGHRIIDLLGLTDSTIARHPEEIAGNESTWRERKFNATYLLQQNPDYILFSTGHKPSAPAERALILHKKFRRNYYTTIFPSPEIQRNLAVHKRKGTYNGPDDVWPDIGWVQDLNRAWNYSIGEGNRDSAITIMSRAKHEGPGDYAMPDYFLADQYYRMQEYDRALAHTDSALAIDSFTVSAWQVRGMICSQQGDTAGVQQAVDYLSRIAPQVLR